MKREKLITVISVVLAVWMLFMVLSGFDKKDNATETSKPATDTEMQDGEQFEAVIQLEGMDETVKYEHIKNEALGFELDYAYDRLVRRSEADRECLISIYDDPENPENYLEVTYRAEDADTVRAAVKEELSKEYEVGDGLPYALERADGCIRIDASAAKDGGGTPDHLQMVYIIPAGDGTYVATAHYFFESAESFGRLFSYLMQSFSIIEKSSGESYSDFPCVGSKIRQIRISHTFRQIYRRWFVLPKSSRFSANVRYHAAKVSKSSSGIEKSSRFSMGSSKPSTPAVVIHSTDFRLNSCSNFDLSQQTGIIVFPSDVPGGFRYALCPV